MGRDEMYLNKSSNNGSMLPKFQKTECEKTMLGDCFYTFI